MKKILWRVKGEEKKGDEIFLNRFSVMGQRWKNRLSFIGDLGDSFIVFGQ
jgi:hypothetical protein